MRLRTIFFALPFAFAAACGGSDDGLTDATPSYAALAMDENTTDTNSASLGSSSAVASTGSESTALSMVGTCGHPHLFIRQREVVERVNRHLYKALRHVEELIAAHPLDSTTTSRTWEKVTARVDRKFTIWLVSPGVYAWELDVGAVGTDPLPVAMTGKIDRTGATTPHEGAGTLHIDLGVLHAAYPDDKATSGTLDIRFDSNAASRKVVVQATQVAWDLDPTMFDGDVIPMALEAKRDGAYVFYRELGKGGSIKIKDRMVFFCPANVTGELANAQLVSRWYRLANGSVHGRSDALMTGGQLPDLSIAKVVGVTCHQSSSEGLDEAEGLWLMKAEDQSGNTVAGASSEELGDTADVCDPGYGPVPQLTNASQDFTAWPDSYSDGVPYPFLPL